MNAQQMITRYREGYSASKITSRVGKIIIAACLTLGAMIFFGGLIYTLNGSSGSFVGMVIAISGASFAIGGWWTGLILSTCGQLMKAQLDIAVNTSVVLDQSQKEAIISASLD